MKPDSKILKTAIIMIIAGFLSSAWAKDRIELTNIEINNFGRRSTINIDTTRPVKFFYYKTGDPPKLVIDFIGTNIYSKEPEKIIFKKGRVRQIQSIFYNSKGAGAKSRLDYLVVEFVPNVAVSIKSSSAGIVLNVEQTQAVAERQSIPLKITEAKILSEKIVQQKRLEQKKKKERVEFAKLSAVGIKRQENSDILSKKSVILSDGGNALNVYNNSAKKELDKILNKEIDEDIISKIGGRKPLVLSGNINYKWLVLAVVAASFILISLIARITRKANKEEREQSQPIMNELDKFFEKYKSYPINQTATRERFSDETDKLLEKRRFARFNLPQDNERSIGIDLETEKLEQVATRVKDLSLGGIRIELRSDIRIPSILQVGLRMPSSTEINYVFAELAWSKDKDEDTRIYGISFMMLTDIEEKKIRRYIYEILS